MLFKIISIVVSLIFVDAFANEHKSGIPNVDHIFDSLSKQQWDPDEAPCRVRIFDILENVQNSTLWAVWVWNSIDQSPTGTFFGARWHLGNYDQCLRPPWLATHPELRTQYCLADIEMHEGGVKTMEPVTDPYVRAEEYYLDSKSPIGRSFSYMAHGVCLPAGCPSKSAKKFVKALLGTGYLRAGRHAAVSIHHCEEAGAPHQYSKGFYIYICSIAILLLTAVTSTYYVSKYPANTSSNSFVNHVAKSFNLCQNWDALLKKSNGDLEILNGIRFIFATLIPFSHRWMMVAVTSTGNGLDMESMLMGLKGILTVHADLITDVFLATSALLLGQRIAMLDVTKPHNLLKYILARYVRLIGVLAVSVMYLAHVSMHTDVGPVYPKLAGVEQQMCEKNWWQILLLVGNYLNVSEMCFPGTWQVCCDFQLYVVTLILLYVYRKNPRVGKAFAAAVLVAGFLCPAINTYMYDLPAVVALDIGTDIHGRKSPNVTNGYFRTHNRMGAYMAGLVVGYFMSVYKPKDYKKLWSKTKSVVGVCASLGLMVVVLMLGWLCYRYRVYGIVASAYATFDRTIFAVGFLGVIVFFTYGDVPSVNSLLSWSVFGILCKLSYSLYLIHQLLQFRRFLSLRSHMRYHFFDLLTESIGDVVVSLAICLPLWLLVEAPIINSLRLYFNTRSSKTKDESNAIKNELEQIEYNKQKIK